MSLVRADLLRELELTPFWRLREAPSVFFEKAPVVAPAPDPVSVPELTVPVSAPIPVAVLDVGDDHCQADWLIVGEAAEALPGEPFTGPVGQLLDAMLAAIGLERGENVALIQLLKSPSPAHLPDFARDIAAVRPKMILALGRFAAQILLNMDTPIGKLRGRVHHYQGVPMVVTYHPAYLLRNAADKARVWEDLLLALRTFRGG